MSVKVGIVGTGWVTERHLAALARIEGAEVAAISGRNEKRLAELCALSKARPYKDWQDMLSEQKLDALLILIPPHLHGELELAAAATVPAVLVEKPLSQDLDTSRRILEAFEKQGTFAAAAYMNRCRASTSALKQYFAPDKQGPILVEGRWVGDLPTPAWWRDKSLSGGQFVEQCTHLVDIARYVTGEVVEVSAFTAKGFVRDSEGYNTDDAMTVSLRFASGALGHFATGCYARSPLMEEGGVRMELSSRECRCSLTGWDMDLRAEEWQGAGLPLKVKTIPGAAGAGKLAGISDIFEVEDRLFLEAAGKADPSLFPSSYEDGIKTLAATLAAVESADQGHPVRPRY